MRPLATAIHLGKHPQPHPLLACGQLAWAVHFERRNGGSADGSQSDNRSGFGINAKMILPMIPTGVEEPNDLTRLLVEALNLVGLVKIARPARQGPVGGVVAAFFLSRNNRLYLEGEVEDCFGSTAVLATMARSADYEGITWVHDPSPRVPGQRLADRQRADRGDLQDTNGPAEGLGDALGRRQRRGVDGPGSPQPERPVGPVLEVSATTSKLRPGSSARPPMHLRVKLCCHDCVASIVSIVTSST